MAVVFNDVVHGYVRRFEVGTVFEKLCAVTFTRGVCKLYIVKYVVFYNLPYIACIKI